MKHARICRFYVIVLMCALCKRADSAATDGVSLRGSVSHVSGTSPNQWATHDNNLAPLDATMVNMTRRLVSGDRCDVEAHFRFNEQLQDANGQPEFHRKDWGPDLIVVSASYVFQDLDQDAWGSTLEIRNLLHGNGFRLVYGADIQPPHDMCSNISWLIGISTFEIKLPGGWHFSMHLSAPVMDAHVENSDGLGQCLVHIPTKYLSYISTATLSQENRGPVQVNCPLKGDGECSILAEKMKVSDVQTYGPALASFCANI